jgi:hypothetical protein
MTYKPDIRPIGKTKHIVGLRSPDNNHRENNKLRESDKELIKSGGKLRVDYYTKTPKNKRSYEGYQEYLYNMKRRQKTNNRGKR